MEGFEPTFSTTSYEYPPYQGGSVHRNLEVIDGLRTRILLNHNQVLHQLSYYHHILGTQTRFELAYPRSTLKMSSSRQVLCHLSYCVHLGVMDGIEPSSAGSQPAASPLKLQNPFYSWSRAVSNS